MARDKFLSVADGGKCRGLIAVCGVQCCVFFKVQSSVYSVVYSVQCSVQYCVHCTVYSVEYCVHCTV